MKYKGDISKLKGFEEEKTTKELGIDVKRKFVILENHGNFRVGDILILKQEDNSYNPGFYLDGVKDRPWNECSRVMKEGEWSYVSLKCLAYLPIKADKKQKTLAPKTTEAAKLELRNLKGRRTRLENKIESIEEIAEERDRIIETIRILEQLID